MDAPGFERAHALAHELDVVGAHEGQAVHGNVQGRIGQGHLLVSTQPRPRIPGLARGRAETAGCAQTDVGNVAGGDVLVGGDEVERVHAVLRQRRGKGGHAAAKVADHGSGGAPLQLLDEDVQRVRRPLGHLLRKAVVVLPNRTQTERKAETEQMNAREGVRRQNR